MPVTAPGMAAQDPFGAKQQSPQGAMGLQRLNGIFGAGWMVPASLWKHGRQDPLIEFDRDDEQVNKEHPDPSQDDEVLHPVPNLPSTIHTEKNWPKIKNNNLLI